MAKQKIVRSNISMENAKIGFRNFSGRAGQFNPEGVRNFCVFLEDDLAEILSTDGWNVKYLDPKDPGDAKVPYLQVTVAYGKYPPRIVMISGNSKQDIGEEDLPILDWAEIEKVDMSIRPYNWEVAGKFGVKAYLYVMYVTIVEDEFAKKYKNVPDSGTDIPDEEAF